MKFDVVEKECMSEQDDSSDAFDKLITQRFNESFDRSRLVPAEEMHKKAWEMLDEEIEYV